MLLRAGAGRGGEVRSKLLERIGFSVVNSRAFAPAAAATAAAATAPLKTTTAETGGRPRAPSLTAIQQARASVQEIGRLLLGRQQCEGGAYLHQEVEEEEEEDVDMVEEEEDEQGDEEDTVYEAPTGTPSTVPSSSPARYDDLPLSPPSLKVLLEVLKFERMTLVQERTLNTILQGKDVVVKAHPGTGKTIAFLLPAIEAVLDSCTDMHEAGGSICSIIVCPARELAMQIFYQTQTLLQFHNGIRVEIITGGFRIAKERVALQKEPCQILVATPGRLLDHLQKTEGFKQRLEKMRLLVIDEADQVLDAGIRTCMEEIVRLIPSYRQTLLFSATIPKEVPSISKLVLKDDFTYIDMAVDATSSDCYRQVKQKYMCAPSEMQLVVLYSILKEHMEKEHNHKVLVFCITARITSLWYQLFKELGFKCMEMHSKKGQMLRFHTYKDFKNSEGSIIMFTSDVSSHGIDYPNVTLVVQVGVPERGGKYINRVGRTGRCGKDGESLLLLLPWEEYFLDKVCNQCIEQVPLPAFDKPIGAKVLSVLSNVDLTTRMHAYRTWLGYYLSLTDLGLSKEAIVRHGNDFSATIGFDKPPVLPRKLISKMGLQGVSGLAKKARS